jgi:hypothetical protein
MALLAVIAMTHFGYIPKPIALQSGRIVIGSMFFHPDLANTKSGAFGVKQWVPPVAYYRLRSER